MGRKFKRVKHFHEPGDLHELTFSCYRGVPLLTNESWRQCLSGQISTACEQHSFRLIAFVFMPEHLHLLTLPETLQPDLGAFVAAIKRPTSARVKLDLVKADSALLRRLVVRERPGKQSFRMWQEGPGYDRNLQGERAVMASIDYIHMNPVRRGLCDRAAEWKWSSARFYQSDPPTQDPDLPHIHGLPAEFFA